MSFRQSLYSWLPNTNNLMNFTQPAFNIYYPFIESPEMRRKRNLRKLCDLICDKSINNFFQENAEIYSDQFFEDAYLLKSRDPKCSYKTLKKNLEVNYNDLKNEDLSMFQNKCELYFSMKRAENKVSSKFLNTIDKLQKSFDNAILRLSDQQVPAKTVKPGIQKREGRWSSIETNHFLAVIKTGVSSGQILNEKGGIDWEIVADYIPGRISKSCHDKFQSLQKKNPLTFSIENLRQLNNKIENYKLNKKFYRALTNDQEENLFNKIKNKIENSEVVQLNDISLMAREIFYSPLALATKALIYSSLREKIIPFDEDGNLNIENFEEKINELLTIATDEPQKLIEEYKLENFKGSKSWCYKFMIRHGLVFRKAHYERRGVINGSHIDIYLNEIIDAVNEFGPDRVLNMDETQIKTNNLSPQMIALKGQETVKCLKENVNEKEGTTFIATVAMNPKKRFPLAIVAKGKTKRSEVKYQIDQSSPELITHSQNGYTTSDVMKVYLKWLRKRMTDGPFALILDVYKSHVEKSVRQLAEKLQIRLIFVPACGTGKYQPLDRRLFGIVKKQLAARELISPTPVDSTRWEYITKETIEIWEKISDEAINSAFDIPDLMRLFNSGFHDDDDTSDSEWNYTEEEDE